MFSFIYPLFHFNIVVLISFLMVQTSMRLNGKKIIQNAHKMSVKRRQFILSEFDACLSNDWMRLMAKTMKTTFIFKCQKERTWS